jgi:hypothetical protein
MYKKEIDDLIGFIEGVDSTFLHKYNDYTDEIYDIYDNNIIPTDNLLKLVGFVCDYYYRKYNHFDKTTSKYIEIMLKYTKIGIENGDQLSMFVQANYEYFYTHNKENVIKLDKMAIENGFYCGFSLILEHLKSYHRFDIIQELSTKYSDHIPKIEIQYLLENYHGSKENSFFPCINILKVAADCAIDIDKIDIGDAEIKYIYNLMLENKKLEKEIIELNSRPPHLGGPMYEEAKAEFELLQK